MTTSVVRSTPMTDIVPQFTLDALLQAGLGPITIRGTITQGISIVMVEVSLSETLRLNREDGTILTAWDFTFERAMAELLVCVSERRAKNAHIMDSFGES